MAIETVQNVYDQALDVLKQRGAGTPGWITYPDSILEILDIAQMRLTLQTPTKFQGALRYTRSYEPSVTPYAVGTDTRYFSLSTSGSSEMLKFNFLLYRIGGVYRRCNIEYDNFDVLLAGNSLKTPSESLPWAFVFGNIIYLNPCTESTAIVVLDMVKYPTAFTSMGSNIQITRVLRPCLVHWLAAKLARKQGWTQKHDEEWMSFKEAWLEITGQAWLEENEGHQDPRKGE